MLISDGQFESLQPKATRSYLPVHSVMLWMMWCEDFDPPCCAGCQCCLRCSGPQLGAGMWQYWVCVIDLGIGDDAGFTCMSYLRNGRFFPSHQPLKIPFLKPCKQ